MTTKPTQQVYAELQHAYEHFNTELFSSRLPSCVITLQRQHDTYGYFSANQFQSSSGGHQAHEIALNPSYFAIRSIQETLSVLVREMVSLDQLLNTKLDKLPRRRYRNREWADMCEQVGLMPTSTGLPGGRRVGDNVQTYVIDGGAFDLACSRLVDESFSISWIDRFPPMLVVSDQDPEANTYPDEDCISSFVVSNVEACEAAPNTDYASVSSDLEVVTATTNISADEAPTVPEAIADAVKPDSPPMKRFENVRADELLERGFEPRERSKNSKTTFQCPACQVKAWGRPSLRISCIGVAEAPHEPQQMDVV